jgi:hypothetical protein
MCGHAVLRRSRQMALCSGALFRCIARCLSYTMRMSLNTGASSHAFVSAHVFLLRRCKRDARNFALRNQSETNMYFVTQGKEAPGQSVPLRWSLQLATERR